MMHQVFIAYANDKGSRNNRDFQAAETICNALEAKDIRCWMAPRDIKGGDDWTEAILEAVKKSKLVVLVFSSNANQSPWVKNEITLALSRNIKIIPFCIEDVPAEGVLEIVMLRYQRIDAFQVQPQDYIDKLVNDVQEHLGTVPGKYDNLVIAGRMLDADLVAFSAVRVMVNMNQTGEAAGTAAYLALDNNTPIPVLNATTIRKTLAEKGSVVI